VDLCILDGYLEKKKPQRTSSLRASASSAVIWKEKTAENAEKTPDP
jgi:hypothetical protein